MEARGAEDSDAVILKRARQHDFRLVQRETAEGRLVFEWHCGDEPPTPFATRRLAIDWMVAWLDGATPAHGVTLPFDEGQGPIVTA